METPREPSATPAWARWTLVAITLAAAWLRLPGLTAEEPWFDEVYSIVLASQDLPELWRRAVADQTNPPGFYLLLWGWLELGGYDLAWMRLLPALAGTITVPAIAVAGRAVGLGWTGAIVAATLAAASPLLVAMSSELRAYALVALVTSLTLAAAAHRRPVLTALGGAVLVLLHYFGAFAVAAIALAAFASEDGPTWPRARRALIPALPSALLLGAWVLVVVRAAGDAPVGVNAAWIDTLSFRDLPSFASQVVGTFGTTSGAVVVSVAALGALALGLRVRAWFAVSLAVLPLALVAVATALTGRELWVARYLIVTLPGWWLLLAAVVDRARGKWREVALAALLTWSSLAGIHADRTRPRKTAWSAVARALTAGGPRTVCTNESFVALPLRYQALSRGIPLTVLDLADCTAARAPSGIVLRAGTESSVERLTRDGATAGRPRDLGTALPATSLVPLRWQGTR